MSVPVAQTAAHGRAVAAMVVVTLMWSLAGVVTRHLQAARSFEVTFWRSAFCALAIAVTLLARHGAGGLLREIRGGGIALGASALCWATMFTAFMLALMWTDVATVLVTMAAGPLVTAIFARLFLRHALGWPGWLAVVAAGVGIVWMQAPGEGSDGTRLRGALVAALVPLAAATNFTLLQATQATPTARGFDRSAAMPVAVLVGAVVSAGVALPVAWPLGATAHDVTWLAFLGVVQLALPCLLVVSISKQLSAPEIALLGLLEVLFGILWAWLGAGETPSSRVIEGAVVVLGSMLAYQASGALFKKPPHIE